MTKTLSRRTGAGAAINPDHVMMHRLIIFGVTVALAAAVLTSWNGLILVGQWQLLPSDLRWLTPVMVDVPLIVLTLARGALRKRGIAAKGLLWGIVALTVFSSTANALHVIAETDGASIQVVIGALTDALSPWLILAMTEVLWLVVTKPIKARKARGKSKSARRPRTVDAAPVQVGLFDEAAA